MNHRGIRLAHVAFVGLCLTWMGCGGSDVPDPNSDTAAAKDEGVPASDTTPAAPSAVSEPAGGQEKQGLAAAENPAPAPSEPTAPPATKGDSSATSELLALANSNAGPAPEGADSADSTKAADPAAGPGQPGEPGGIAGAVIGVRGPGGGSGGYPASSNSMQGAPGGAAPAGAPAGYPTGGPPGVPGVSGGPGRGGREGMNIPQGYGAPGVGGAGAPGGGAVAPGGPGGRLGEAGGAMLGGPGGSAGGGAGRGGVYAVQYAAATEFLDAVKSKNKDKLAEVVALRAPQEAATEKNKKLFSAILDQSIADSDMDEIAKALEGFQIMGNNEAKSSGRLGIIIGKTGTDGDHYQRTITVRKEAKGWRVVDVSGQSKIDAPSRGRTKGRTR